MRAFEAAGLKPSVVLSALDADVVKSYVELGLGVAILSTPKGIQTGKQAKKDNMGGEVLCHVW